MKVTKIKFLKTNNKIKITFDNEEQIELFQDVYAENNLFINKIITEDEFLKLKDDNELQKYFSLASKRLLVKQYSPNKLEEFLKKSGANKNQIKAVHLKLKSIGLIDETKYVQSIIDYCDTRHYGYNRLIKMLKERLITQKEIEKIKYDSEREEREAKILIEKLNHKLNGKNEFKQKKFLISTLVNYGFNKLLAVELVNKISNSNHNIEINVLKLDYKKSFERYSKKYNGFELEQKVTSHLLSLGYKIEDIRWLKGENA